ncbi:MAG: hypothetical protein KQH83_06110 [Actinobacteria bacterium]|nr:hypothetical protein [Actinomycetota bacterium]
MSAPSLPIRRRSTALLVPPILVVAAYLLFAGHNRPGGGFVGGLVAGLALALAHASDGPGAVRRITRVAPTTLLGAGLVIAGIAGAGGWLGGGFLDGGAVELTLPVFGTVKAASATLFDTGVFAVVAGMVGLVLESLSGEETPS